MWPRHRLDLGYTDACTGLAGCLRPGEPFDESALLDQVGLTGRAVVASSVRAGWELLLTVLDWPAGDEVIVTAITHPDMVRILEAHGLRAVVVDVDPLTTAPDLAEVAAACTERTRAVLVAQLFGGRIDLAPLIGFTRARGLLLVEDAAQAFTGPASLRGRGTDVSLISFGMIKTAAAVGGAIVTIDDVDLCGRAAQLQQSWPVQSRAGYARRMLLAMLVIALSRPAPYTVFRVCCWTLARDPDTVLTRATRSYSAPGPEALRVRLQQRPPGALGNLLSRRLRRFDSDRLDRRAAVGEQVAAQLPAGLTQLGGRLRDRTHWLFPVIAADPAALVARLRGAGFDASGATSNLVAVTGTDGATAPLATRAMASVVYLPVYPELTAAAIQRLVDALADAAQ